MVKGWVCREMCSTIFVYSILPCISLPCTILHECIALHSCSSCPLYPTPLPSLSPCMPLCPCTPHSLHFLHPPALHAPVLSCVPLQSLPQHPPSIIFPACFSTLAFLTPCTPCSHLPCMPTHSLRPLSSTVVCLMVLGGCRIYLHENVFHQISG